MTIPEPSADPGMPSRKPISKRLRFEILRRDGFRCHYCGATPDETELRIDHVLPVTLGGQTVPENLVAACHPCNAGKTSSSPDAHDVERVADDAARWADAIENVCLERQEEHALVNESIDNFVEAWNAWSTLKKARVPANWPDSIRRFIGLGLDGDDFIYYVGITASSRAAPQDKFRYFCGCCWNEITTRQDMAAQMIADEDAAPGGVA